MRALIVCRVLILAGLAGRALAPTAVEAAAAPHAAPPRAGAAPGASLAPRALAVHAGARVQPSYARKAPAAPAPLAARPRPGKNVPTTLGGPAKYDAKKGAMLGGGVMPH